MNQQKTKRVAIGLINHSRKQLFTLHPKASRDGARQAWRGEALPSPSSPAMPPPPAPPGRPPQWNAAHGQGGVGWSPESVEGGSQSEQAVLTLPYLILPFSAISAASRWLWWASSLIAQWWSLCFVGRKFWVQCSASPTKGSQVEGCVRKILDWCGPGELLPVEVSRTDLKWASGEGSFACYNQMISF